MKLPSYFISHGGDPWPYVPEMRAMMRKLEHSLQDIPRQIEVLPKAVLMESAHWEEVDSYAVMVSPRPPMLYDYGGFPHILSGDIRRARCTKAGQPRT